MAKCTTLSDVSEVRIHVAVPSEIHRAAKATAATTGRTLKQVVIDGLCHEAGWAEIGAGSIPPEWTGRTEAATPTGKGSKAPPVDCTHPKAALVQLAGGLARCGACGTNRKADGTWP